MRREVNDLTVSELERLADYMSTHTHNQYNNQNIHFLSLSDFCVLHRHDKIFIFIRSYSVISVRCLSSCPPDSSIVRVSILFGVLFSFVAQRLQINK